MENGELDGGTVGNCDQDAIAPMRRNLAGAAAAATSDCPLLSPRAGRVGGSRGLAPPLEGFNGGVTARERWLALGQAGRMRAAAIAPFALERSRDALNAKIRVTGAADDFQGVTWR